MIAKIKCYGRYLLWSKPRYCSNFENLNNHVELVNQFVFNTNFYVFE